jgi:hypothetical protein
MDGLIDNMRLAWATDIHLNFLPDMGSDGSVCEISAKLAASIA